MSRALAALALAFALGGGPPLQWVASLFEAVLSGTPDYGGTFDPHGSEPSSDYGSRWDPDG